MWCSVLYMYMYMYMHVYYVYVFLQAANVSCTSSDSAPKAIPPTAGTTCAARRRTQVT